MAPLVEILTFHCLEKDRERNRPINRGRQSDKVTQTDGKRDAERKGKTETEKRKKEPKRETDETKRDRETKERAREIVKETDRGRERQTKEKDRKTDRDI